MAVIAIILSLHFPTKRLTRLTGWCTIVSMVSLRRLWAMKKREVDHIGTPKLTKGSKNRDLAV